VGIMGTVSKVLHRLGMQGAGAQALSVAINARSFFDDVSSGEGRAGGFLLRLSLFLPAPLGSHCSLTRPRGMAGPQSAGGWGPQGTCQVALSLLQVAEQHPIQSPAPFHL
jgi:hypothetical protein